MGTKYGNISSAVILPRQKNLGSTGSETQIPAMAKITLLFKLLNLEGDLLLSEIWGRKLMAH